jgi:ABC-2 type transport system ATP-binding protein
MTDALIETSGLSKDYGETHALAPLDWDVRSGSITGILGPNGAGKTTLIKLLLGITWPTSGSIRVLGRDVADDSERIRGKVGFLPEDKLLYDDMSIQAFLRFYGSFFPGWNEDAMGGLLESWGIGLTSRIKELSKGNRAKLVLGAVLCRSPRILLLDEPTIDLDPASGEEVLSLLAQWAAGQGRAVVITTHRLEEVERICDQILVLLDGEVALRGELDDLRAAWKRIRVTGEVPELETIREWPGVRSVSGGAGWTDLVVDSGAEEVAEDLRTAGAGEVVVEGLSLREMYLTLTGYEGGRLDEALEGVV